MRLQRVRLAERQLRPCERAVPLQAEVRRPVLLGLRGRLRKRPRRLQEVRLPRRRSQVGQLRRRLGAVRVPGRRRRAHLRSVSDRLLRLLGERMQRCTRSNLLSYE